MLCVWNNFISSACSFKGRDYKLVIVIYYNKDLIMKNIYCQDFYMKQVLIHSQYHNFLSSILKSVQVKWRLSYC
jgi:hypothetical protein